jgi:hypothetical protein
MGDLFCKDNYQLSSTGRAFPNRDCELYGDFLLGICKRREGVS